MRSHRTTRTSHAQATRNLTVRGVVGTMVTFGVLLAALFAPVLTAAAVGSVAALAVLVTRLPRFRVGSPVPVPDDSVVSE